MIRANCLFCAVGWKEWGRKKDRKRLFPTTPPASSLKRGFAQIISEFARLSSTMVLFSLSAAEASADKNRANPLFRLLAGGVVGPLSVFLSSPLLPANCTEKTVRSNHICARSNFINHGSYFLQRKQILPNGY